MADGWWLMADGWWQPGCPDALFKRWFPRLTRGRTFLVLPRKVAKRRRAHCGARLRRVLCAAQAQRGAAELGPAGLRQSSPFFPLPPALLDAAEGRGKSVSDLRSTVKMGVFASRPYKPVSIDVCSNFSAS